LCKECFSAKNLLISKTQTPFLKFNLISLTPILSSNLIFALLDSMKKVLSIYSTSLWMITNHTKYNLVPSTSVIYPTSRVPLNYPLTNYTSTYGSTIRNACDTITFSMNNQPYYHQRIPLNPLNNPSNHMSNPSNYMSNPSNYMSNPSNPLNNPSNYMNYLFYRMNNSSNHPSANSSNHPSANSSNHP
jgi:hypothetical protein